jgi:hypothetical protein
MPLRQGADSSTVTGLARGRFGVASRALTVLAMTVVAVTGGQILDASNAVAGPAVAGNSITFTSSPPTLSSSSSQVLGVTGNTYVPAGVTRSGDPLTFSIDSSSTPGACSLAGGTVSFEAPGVCIIDANDAGNASYAAAPQEQQSIDVNDAPTCAALAYQRPGLSDGDYTLDVQGVATSLYCADMSTSPAEYLDLPAGTSTNYSQLGSHWAYSGTGAISTSYTKVRFLPASLQIENANTTFATSTGSNGENGASAVAWGIAAACGGSNASFEVNLEGTRFSFTYGMNGFGAAGSNYNGAPMVADDATNQAFSAANVNGFCGHAGFHSPNPGGPGYAGVWGTPSNGTGSFQVQVSELDGSGQPIVGQALSFVQTAATPLAAGTVQTAVEGVASGATPSYSASGACTVDQNGLVTLNRVGTCTVVVSSSVSGEAIAGTAVAESFQVIGAQSVQITSSDSAAVIGSTYSLTSTGGSSGNPVDYSVDPASAGRCQLDQSGTVVDLESPGACVIDANQQGDGDYSAAPQQQQTLTVTQAATTTTVTSAPAVTGQPITLTATVAITSPGSDTYSSPGGNVEFQSSQDGISWADLTGCSTIPLSWPLTPSLLNTGTATCTTSFPVAGGAGHADVRALYSGDANFSGSATSSTTIEASPDATSTAVSSGQSPSAPAATVEFRAQVTAASPGAGVPTGTVTFSDAGRVLCSAAPLSAGAAECRTSLPPQPASQMVTAVYSGSAAMTGSAGAVVQSVLHGYWLAGSDGSVSAHGDAVGYGSLLGVRLNKPVVAIAATRDGRGYWLAAADGGVFTFGDAGFYGSAAHVHLVGRVVAIAATPDGRGYWLAAADGGVFTFGDARFYGSAAGSVPAGARVVGLAASAAGYWLALSNGQVRGFADAHNYGPGSAGTVGIAATGDAFGYWVVSGGGRVQPFGDAVNDGSASGVLNGVTVLAMADL